MEPVICLEMIYYELDPTEKIVRIADLGFNNVEFWGWRDKNIPALSSACKENGVQIVNFSGHRRGSLIASETHDLFLSELQDALEAARVLESSTLMILTNELGEGGIVTERYDDISSSEKYKNLVCGLGKALDMTPEEINLVLEPVNTIDHPGYYLADMDTAVAIIREINNPRLKILCDLYHMGVMEENLEVIIERNLDDIGYIHIADIPGRHEPGTGSVDWISLLGLIRDKGYAGYVGFEYSPLKDSDESLLRIRSLWDKVKR